MLGSQGDWPAGGELDIMERIGHQPGRIFSMVHTTSGSGGSGNGTAFHHYQVHFPVDMEIDHVRIYQRDQ